MSPERWQKIDQLLDQALELSAEQRATFLREACAGDDELRREIESLLAAHERSGSFIETNPAHGLVAAVSKQYLQTAPPAMIGRTLGHYELVALLGSGGMGDVYRARDTRLDRNVAIKVLPQHLSSHPDALARFEREAKAVAALSHPNILAIHDFGHEGGVAYAVMELLEGETLRSRLSSSPLNWREMVKVSAPVAEGLAAAHARGIIHRDIKPENIFLTADGLVKVLDFGIARVKKAVIRSADTVISQGLNETKPGTLMGTIGYMSPEQVRGESADAPSDIFSLGCVMVEMLTGERPFARQSAAETMAAILRDDLPSLETVSQDFPPELERIIQRCLEKTPEERFQSARDLAFDLRSLLTSASGAYRVSSGAHQRVMTTSPPPRVRASWLIPGLLVGVLAIVLGAIGFMWSRPKAKPESKPVSTSLAVLPFINETHGEDQDKKLEILCDGMTESIIGSLTPLRPKLHVLAYNSVKRYKGKKIDDPRQAGRELDVNVLLIGTILKQNDLLDVSVELVDATDGSRLWKDRYLRNYTSLIAVQSEIPLRVAEMLHLELTEAKRMQIAKRYTENAQAYELYLNGNDLVSQRSNEALKKAIECYKRATELDPKYALAYSGMADAYALIYEGGTIRDQARNQSLLFSNRAISLDPQLAEPYSTLGFLEVFRNKNWEAAEKYFQQAQKLNANYETAYHWHAIMLAIQGCFDAALNEINRARIFSPYSFPINKDMGEILFHARRYDEAINQLRLTIKDEPANSKVPEAHLWIKNCYEQKGDFESAIKELELLFKPPALAGLREAFEQSGPDGYWQKRLESQANRDDRDTPDGRMRLILTNAQAGNVDQAMKLLERVMNEDRHDGLIYMKVDPRFDKLRSHPQFPEMLRRMNLLN